MQPSIDAKLRRGARLVLAVGLVASSVALLYSVLTYERRLGGVASVILYYALPAAAVVGLAAARRASGDTQLKLGLLLALTLGALYTAEAGLGYVRATRTEYGLPATVADSACPRALPERWMCLTMVAVGGEFDARTRMQVIDDLRAAGREAWPSVDGVTAISSDPPRIDGRAIAPIAPGVSRVPTLFCNELGEWGMYQSDEFGFRNPVGRHVPDRVAVLLVGDSFAHGGCTAADSDIVGVLREAVPSVVSLGVESSGPLTTLASIREYAAHLRPPVVVWLFYEDDDLINLHEESQHDILRRYLEPGFRQGLRPLQERLDPVLKEWVVEVRREQERTLAERVRVREEADRRIRNRPWMRWIKLWELRSAVPRWLEGPSVRQHPPNVELFGKVLEMARSDVHAWGGEMLLVYLPSRRRLAGEPGSNPYRLEVLARAAELGIRAADLVPVFSAHPDPLSLFPYRVTPHYTEEGNGLVVDAVMEVLREVGTP
jgi:hypothetical protein